MCQQCSAGANCRDLAVHTRELRVPVLVAEDSEDNRFLLEAYCKGSEYDLTFAENGQQAVAFFQSAAFEIVIMDIQMPVMDGLEATRRIRQWEADQGRTRTPILALTANVLPQNAAEATAAGCDLHLAKPISRTRFLRTLEQWKPVPPIGEDTIRIEVEPGMEQLALSYVIARQREMPLFQDLFQRCAFDEIRRLAHNLVGTGTSYGFPELSRIGSAIARAGLGRDADNLQHLIGSLNTYLEAAGQQVRLQW